MKNGATILKRLTLVGQTVHAAYRAYRKFAQIEPALPAWENLTGPAKADALALAEYLLTPEATPESLHERWLADRADFLWVYGPQFNFGIKNDPHIVPWSGLPDSVKLGYRLQLTITRTLVP